ncbi:hypothetical protein ACFP3Q_08890 [Nocardioides sp. GCM10027113]|uniref:hypothetical protein n=1 Tax=unclassified Nocardioides TaxID=2615069 RepID=UPI00361513CA
MSTLDDLRNTLDQQARGLHDDAVADRADAVRGRVRAVRRRRAAAVVAAAAVAVAGVAVAVTDGSSDIDPASDRELVGQVAPSAMSSLGYVYEYSSGQEGTDRLEVELAAGDGPRLVSWATGSEAQEVTYWLSDGRAGRADAVDFGDFVWVSPGYEGTFTLKGDGDLGVAVYELSEGFDPPAGYTERGITFRQNIAGATLAGADLGEPGDAELTVEADVSGRVQLSFLCAGGPANTWTHYEVDGRPGGAFGPGCDDGAFDPGDGGVTTTVDLTGSPVQVRMWVTRGEDGPRVDDEDLTVGLGLYEPPPPAARLAGQRVEEVVERLGHRWRLVDTGEMPPGGRDIEAAALPGRDTLVVGYFRSGAESLVLEVLNGRTGTEWATGVGAPEIGILHDGRGTAGLEVRGGAEGLELGIARYERVD